MQLGPGLYPVSYPPKEALLSLTRAAPARGSISPSTPFMLIDEITANSEDYCSSGAGTDSGVTGPSEQVTTAGAVVPFPQPNSYTRMEAIWEALWFGQPRPGSSWGMSYTSSASAVPSSPEAAAARPLRHKASDQDLQQLDSSEQHSSPDQQLDAQPQRSSRPYDSSRQRIFSDQLANRSVSISSSAAIDVGGRSPGGARGVPPLRLSTPPTAQPGSAAVKVRHVPSSRTRTSIDCHGVPVLGTWANRQYRLLTHEFTEDEHLDSGLPVTRAHSEYTAANSDPDFNLVAAVSEPFSVPQVSPSLEVMLRKRSPLQCAPGSHFSIRPRGAGAMTHCSSPTEVACSAGGCISSSSATCTAGSGSAATGCMPLPDGRSTELMVPALPVNVPTRELADDEAVDAAWRWRFTRRWHAEQARVAEAGPEPRGSGGGDEVEDALQYLTAWGGGGGAGWSIAKNDSLGLPSVLGSGLNGGSSGALADGPSLMQSESLVGLEVLLGEDSPRCEGRSSLCRQQSNEMAMPATREISSMRKVAHELLQQQAEVEKRAEQRWKECMNGTGDAWVGSGLAQVQVDDWGSFRFLLIRLKDRYAHQKIIVRGHNHSSEASIVQDVAREMMQAATVLRLPMEPVQVMGGGIMDWRRDGTSHVQLHSGFLSNANGCNKLMTKGDLLSLASAMIKQSLPPQFKVTVGAT